MADEEPKLTFEFAGQRLELRHPDIKVAIRGLPSWKRAVLAVCVLEAIGAVNDVEDGLGNNG